MTKFKQLLDYIISRNLVAEEKISSFITNCTLQISATKETTTGLVAAYKTYQGVYEFENYQGNADTLLTHFVCWIYANEQSDHNQEHPLPRFDIEPVNDHLVDVMVEIEFSEKITLLQDDNGEFEFDGVNYRLADIAITDAESFDVEAEVVQ
jgi:hypothetical protein